MTSGTLQCIADNTGGKFLRADNAAGLTKALGTAVEAVKKPAPKPVVEKAANPGLHLSSVLAEGAEPFDQRVTYSVYKPDKDLQGNRERVTYGIDPAVTFQLPSGRYFVTAEYQSAFASTEVDVVADQAQRVVMNLNAGLLAVSSKLEADAGPFDQRVTYSVFRSVSDLEGTREERVTYGIDPAVQFYLPAGEYTVAADFQTVSTRAKLTIRANERTEHVFDLNAGLLAVSSMLSADAGPFDQRVSYQVFVTVSDIKGTRQERVTYGIDPAVQFYLAAGSYTVRAEFQTASASATLEILPNQRTEHVFDLNAGLLALSGVMTPGVPATDRISFQVFKTVNDLSGAREERVTYGIDPTVEFYLTAGSYQVTAGLQSAEVKTAVDIVANQRNETVMDLNAGVLSIDGKIGGAPLTDRATYQVYRSVGGGGNSTGERVTYGIDPTVQFILSAGSYVVTGELGSMKGEAEVRVEAGKNVKLTIPFDG